MWGLIHNHIAEETPHLSRYSTSIFKTLLPNALHTLDWAEKEHLRCVLQVIAIGITSDPSTSIAIISKGNGRVEAIGKCLEVPDLFPNTRGNDPDPAVRCSVPSKGRFSNSASDTRTPILVQDVHTTHNYYAGAATVCDGVQLEQDKHIFGCAVA
jgi:hypothetical protein